MVIIKADSVPAKKLRDAANRVREIYDLPKSTMYVKKLKAHKNVSLLIWPKNLLWMNMDILIPDGLYVLNPCSNRPFYCRI